MDFTFNEDQLVFHDSVKSFLTNEVTPERIREQWTTESGRSSDLWDQLAELGLTAMTVPEAFGGLGMNELDFILLAEECGYVALAEPLVDTVLVAVPLINSLGNEQKHFKESWLPRIAEGKATVAVGHQNNPLVADAHIADLLLLPNGNEVHAVPSEQVELLLNESVDPSRKLYKVTWTPSAETLVANEEEGKKLWEATLNRGALAAAAQQLGLARRIVDLSVDYTYERKQFGKPVGSFQAVKHHMANVAVKIEFAKAPLYRAAYDIAEGLSTAGRSVSHAKLATSEAALLGAKNGIQVHGAMGYTWEVDLHIFMKRAWALDASYGSQGFHKKRVKDSLLAEGALLGAGNSFVN
ncbi:acyl-CoA dehydrogenase family protein [Endozoicomonas numazuensis]|uniref:Acyl-CoA dehydrogenase n=1 Tax=Endozoicomonas numazuensis TaxID=1137799 RepID=A0A081NMH4_9GAMM|nr:acyl-CoA dehydrogenase family protein [Endozoicomonas numazuensis]KEQ19647.1 acyl-CoA dehydrogenase [Endozoicomonas numazuensis]